MINGHLFIITHFAGQANPSRHQDINSSAGRDIDYTQSIPFPDARTPASALRYLTVVDIVGVLVAPAGILTLHELPGRLQWLGIALFGTGAISYFWGSAALTGRGLGLVLACLTMGANAGASLLGKWMNRGQRLTPLVVTSISMGVGAVVMLLLGLVIEGWPAIGLWN